MDLGLPLIFSNPLTSVYEGSEGPMVFYRELIVAEKSTGDLTVTAGLHFQTCDANLCLPSETQTEGLVLKVINH